VHNLHDDYSSHDGHQIVFVAGRTGMFRNLTLVLKGNNPRFPVESSTTMLTGTNEVSVSDRGEQAQSPPQPSHQAALG
jgi:hypothetical protein